MSIFFHVLQMAESNQFHDVPFTWYLPFGMELSSSDIREIQQFCDDMLNDEFCFDESDCWVLNLIVSGIFKGA